MEILRKSVFASLVAAIALSLIFLSPLPRWAAEGIGFSSYGGAEPAELVQGDHLQLLYHFDLFDSFLRGRLPWFRNLYEFNTSDDVCPARPDPYYAPFALPYSILHRFTSDAAAWNASQFLSVFIGLFFCILLARRCGAPLPVAILCAALATCLPYRWTNLTGGSPTGFGMAFVPGIAWATDVAVRDRRLSGGVWLAVLLACCYATDLHCILFAGLFLPLWGVVALVRSGENPFASRRNFFAFLRPLLPVLILGLAGLFIMKALSGGYASTDAASGRTLRELTHHSPEWRSFLNASYECRFAGQYFNGFGLFAALALSTFALVARCASWKRADSATRRETIAFALVALGALFCLLLGLGVHGYPRVSVPTNEVFTGRCGIPLIALRKLLPPFRMVRQPVKVFCLLPALYTMFFAFAAAPLRKRLASALLAVLLCVAVVTAVAPMRVGICLLPKVNGSYVAAVEDARAKGVVPRALILPIWPGDSSYSSIYQYNAMRAGLRMLNGYSAVKSPDYVDNVFRRYESMTSGVIADEQLDALAEIGVTHVILHENAWPPKVSRHPFAYTLRAFLFDGRFKFVGEDRGAWLFSIVPGASKLQRADVALPELPVSRYCKFRDGALCAAEPFALEPDSSGAVRLNVAEMEHESGVTALDPATRMPSALAFVPGRDPATLAFRGPFLPLGLPAGKCAFKAVFDGEPSDGCLFILRVGAAEQSFRPGETAEFEYDGVSPVTVEFHYDGKSGLVFKTIEFSALQ